MIRTGSIGLDVSLRGGWKPGTMNEIWGDSGSGKTTVALHTTRNARADGLHVMWIDLAGAAALMDDLPASVMVAPGMNSAETVFAMAEVACQEPAIGLVVVDPAHLLARQIELDGDPVFVPHPQREFKAELTALKRAAKASGTVVLFVSQPRDKQREPIRGTGISEKVFMRVHLHPDVVHQDGSREIVASVKDVPGKTVKHAAAKFTIRPGKGIDQALELARVAAKYNVVHKSGSWYHWPNGVSAHGVHEMATELRQRPHFMHSVDNEIRAIAGIA